MAHVGSAQTEVELGLLMQQVRGLLEEPAPVAKSASSDVGHVHPRIGRVVRPACTVYAAFSKKGNVLRRWSGSRLRTAFISIIRKTSREFLWAFAC